MKLLNTLGIFALVLTLSLVYGCTPPEPDGIISFISPSKTANAHEPVTFTWKPPNFSNTESIEYTLLLNGREFDKWTEMDDDSNHSVEVTFVESGSNSIYLRSLISNGKVYTLPNNHYVTVTGDDIDDDGIPDSIEASLCPPNNITCVTLDTAIGNRTFLVRDANGDGYKDLILVDPASGNEQIFLGDGSNKFSGANSLNENLVGSVSGSFRVSESGAATYSIPIIAAQGVAGVSPQISLNYSSDAGFGIAGRGWSVGGLSAISRCRQTLGSDGNANALTLTGEDRFCFGGQRLVLANPSSTYGAKDEEYKTEIDSFTVIKSHDGSLGHPDYFTVTGKDGSTTIYGNSATYAPTNQAEFILDDNNALKTIMAWSISRFGDSVGNNIHYIYEGDTDSGHRIKSINYAYSSTNVTANQTSNTKLVFNYQDRPDSHTGYIAGYVSTSNKRLSNIQSFSNNENNQQEEIRNYQLFYEDSKTTNNKSYIAKIYECVESDCLKATSFDVDFAGSYSFNSSANVDIDLQAVNKDDRNLHTYTLGDINGDGCTDIVWAEADGNDPTRTDDLYDLLLYQISTSTSANPNECTQWVRGTFTDGTNQLRYESNGDIQLEFFDYNADGRQDVAMYRFTNWFIFLSVLQSDGTWKLSSNPISLPHFTSRATKFIDIDADGLTDAVTILPDGNLSIYKLQHVNESLGSTTYYEFVDQGTVTSEFPVVDNSLLYQYGLGYQRNWFIEPTTGDFNGDGRMDFLVKEVISSYTVVNPGIYYPILYVIVSPYYMTSDGHYVVGEPIFKKYSSKLFGGDWNVPVAEATKDGYAMTADINGDGLSDLIYKDFEGNLYYSFATGTADVLSANGVSGFTTGTKFPDSGVSWPAPHFAGSHAVIRFGDYNNDGTIDVLRPDSNLTRTYEFDASTQSFSLAEATFPFGDKNNLVMLNDINGDTIMDYVHVHTWGDDAAFRAYWGVADEPSSSGALGLVHTIDNGMGNVTSVDYEKLNKTDSYTRLSGDLFPGLFYLALNNDWVVTDNAPSVLSKNNIPVLELFAPVNVVTRVTGTAPTYNSWLGGTDVNATSEVEYEYTEAKFQAGGRGILGFKKIRSIDKNTGIETLTEFRQDFPFIGMPLNTRVYSNGSNGSTLKYSENRYTLAGYNSTAKTADIPYQITLEQVLETNYALGTTTELSTSLTEMTQDSWGNVLSTSTSVYTTLSKALDRNGPFSVVTTDNSYDGMYAQQFGRLSESKVTHTRGTDSEERTAKFTYYPYDADNNEILRDHSLLLASEVTVTPDGTSTVTTGYQYDTKGNIEKVSTCTGAGYDENSQACLGQAASRYSRTTYDSNGRFPVSTYNALENDWGSSVPLQTIVSRNATGQATEINGLNGSNSIIEYDVLGRESYRSDNSGAWVRNTPSVDGLGEVSSAVYKTVVTSADGGSAVQYFDALGRSVAKSSQSFSETVWTETQYDNAGRVYRQSVPHFQSSINWVTYEYDASGRATKTTQPDGSFTETDYNGLQTILTISTTNADGSDASKVADFSVQKKTMNHNVLGEKTFTGDDQWAATLFTYTPAGLVLNTKQYYSSATYTISFEYDQLGRKTKMVDPDKGTWYYQYNAYGELENQFSVSEYNENGSFNPLTTDLQTAKGLGDVVLHYSHMEYDELGRMDKRYDYADWGSAASTTSSWTYDTAPNGLGELAQETGGGLTKTYVYGAYGSNNRTDSVKLSGDSIVNGYQEISTVYNAIGQVYKQTDVLGSDSGTINSYNAYGYLQAVNDIASDDRIYSVTEMDAFGNVVAEENVQGGTIVNISRIYDPKTGRLLHQWVGDWGSFQSTEYTWDALGNMKSREDRTGTATSQKQTFCYDNVNRLIKTYQGTLTGSCGTSLAYADQNQVYDNLGRIQSKGGLTNYIYSTGDFQPHAVQSLSDGASTINFIYDKTGNMIRDEIGTTLRRSLTYSSFDKLTQVTKGNAQIQFSYGADRSRWKRIDRDLSKNGPTGLATTYYLGNIERVDRGDDGYTLKRYIAGGLWTSEYNKDGVFQSQSLKKQYMITDVLGSVVGIFDSTTQQYVQQSAFSPFGERVNTSNWNLTLTDSLLTPLSDLSFATTRGFTGHEMMDAVGLIHMNGRIYDPKIGRFLQADPIIQAPSNPQSYDRYAYVLNNPLKYTDPSGFSWSSFRDNVLKPAIGVVVAYVGYVVGGPWGAATFSAAWTAGSMGYENGTWYGALRAGTVAGVSAYAFSAIGVDPGLNWGEAVVAAGLVGGVGSVAMDGKFGHGFVAAGIGAGFARSGYAPKGVPARMVVAALLGGTASEMTGGKFANGAVTAALAAAVTAGVDYISSASAQDSSGNSFGGKEAFNKAKEALNTNKELSDIAGTGSNHRYVDSHMVSKNINGRNVYEKLGGADIDSTLNASLEVFNAKNGGGWRGVAGSCAQGSTCTIYRGGTSSSFAYGPMSRGVIPQYTMSTGSSVESVIITMAHEMVHYNTGRVHLQNSSRMSEMPFGRAQQGAIDIYRGGLK